MSNEVVKKEELFLQEIPVVGETLKVFFDRLNDEFKLFERVPLFVMRLAMKKDILHAVYLTDGKEAYGYAVYQEIPGYDSIHVLYLAILPDYRSLGLGSVLMQQLKKLTKDGIIFEVEDPEAARNEDDLITRNRRIAFYKRNGFHLNQGVKVKDFNHMLLLMSTKKLPKLDKHKFKKFYQGLFNRVYRIPVGKISIKTYVD